MQTSFKYKLQIFTISTLFASLAVNLELVENKFRTFTSVSCVSCLCVKKAAAN